MFAARQMARMGPRFGQPLRAPVQRRLMSSPTSDPKANKFVRDRLAVKEHAKDTTELWRKISIYVCIPALFLAGANAYYLYEEHWEHWSHMPPLEERTEYSYQNIRTKNFPFGDGDKTMFWNDSVNYHNKDKVA